MLIWFCFVQMEFLGIYKNDVKIQGLLSLSNRGHLQPPSPCKFSSFSSVNHVVFPKSDICLKILLDLSMLFVMKFSPFMGTRLLLQLMENRTEILNMFPWQLSHYLVEIL